MGKELWTGRSVLKRFFREFFIRVLDDIKESRSPRSSNRQSKELQSYSPQILIFQGENGLGKSSSIVQCASIVEELGIEYKKNTVSIIVDFEDIFLEKGCIPNSSKDMTEVIFAIIQKNSEISQYFTKYREFTEKSIKVNAQIDYLLREEWPVELQNISIGESKGTTDPLHQYSNWLQKKLSKQDFDIFSNNDKYRTDFFIKGILDASMEVPLLLAFDSCEYLPRVLEIWLRQELIAKLYEKNHPLVTIVSGYGNFSRLYRNDFPEDLIFSFDFANLTFSKTDISSVASNLNCTITEEEVTQIENFTAGIPMAVIDIVSHIKNGFSCSDLVSDTRNETWNAQEIVQGIVDRFLSNCSDEQTKFRVFSLSIMDQFDANILAELWGIKSSEVASAITDLQKHITFIPNRKLHSTVRGFLRDYLLKEREKEVSEVEHLFLTYKKVCEKLMIEQLSQLKNEIPTIEKRYSDDRYAKAIINIIGSSLWTSPEDALKNFSVFYIELLYFNPALISQLIWRIGEYQQSFLPEQNDIIELLNSGIAYSETELVRNSVPVDSRENAIVEYLEQFTVSMTTFQLAMLLKKKGEINLRTGDHQKALEEFKKGLELFENSNSERTLFYDSFLLLGNAFKSSQDLESAVAVYTIALSIRPDSFLPHYEAGFSRIQLGQYTEAVSVLIEAVKINSDHQDAWFNLGFGYSALGEYETAVEALTKASEKGPKNQFILFEMGKVLNKLKRHDDAVEALSKVVETNKNHFDAWYIAGSSYSALGKSDNAIEAYRKAIEIKPDMIEALQSLAQELYLKKSFLESAEMYEKAIKIDGDNHLLWSNLAKVWFDAEKFENAIEAGQKSVSFSLHELEPWMTLGNAYTALGKYSDAIGAFSKASKIAPENASILNLIGKNYYAQEDYEKAIEAFEKSAKLNPSIEESWVDIGLAYSAQEKYAEAASAFLKASEIEPQKVHIWLQLGDIYMALQQFNDAVMSYSKAALLEPQSHDILYRKGMACMRTDDFDEAIISLVKAAELCNSDTDIWFQMGTAYYAAGHTDEAIEAFQMASTLDPLRPENWTQLGNAKQDRGLYEESITAFTKAIELVPDNSVTWMRMGACNYLLQKYNEAISAYKKALALDPDNIEIFQQLGLICHAAGDLDSAIEYYRIITDKNPDVDDAWFNMALALHAKGDFDNAIHVYKKTIGNSPENADAWYNLGLAYHGNNEHNDAIKAYRQATKLNPDLPEIWFHLGIAFNALEHYGEAIQAYRKVVQLNSDNSDAWFNLGLSYYVWGQYDDALESFGKVLELKPDHFDALANLCATYYAMSNSDKTIEFGLKALVHENEPTIRTFLIASYILKQNVESATEHVNALLSIDLTQDEIAKTLDFMRVFQSKNDSVELIDNLLERLCEAASAEFINS
jgi:tetratricopeptide (TPR) repeat protein